ncbi:glycoside hydrolase family 88 protein, partial [uncultured Prevotella sp.]|uniref:glycoside hydrolase family 88 protein n=1 Tax=uncultured Prevotella sp. TaxID=159272 RepID=UPI0028057C44
MRISKLCSGGKGISLRHGKQLLRCLPLVGMLLATSSVNATDSPGEVKKFNSDVRYSQWAINSRTNDFYANTTSFGLATYKADGTKLNDRKDTKGKLDYVPGLVSKSIIEAADYYQSFDWSKPWFFTVKEYGNTYYKDVQTTGESFDNLNATKLYIGIYNNKYATDADKSNAKTALASVKTGFINANKTYVIPTGTLAEKAGNKVAGGWWHKKIYQNQMWLDGAYMGSALLAQLTQFYGASDNVFGSKKADWEMVAKQMNIVWNMCWNSKDRLMYHAFDATATAKAKDNSSNTWFGLSSTTPYVFHSAAYWGRADAWYLYALVDVLEAMKADGQESTNNYTTLKSHLDELAAGIAARQDKTTGGWYQLLDKDASFKSTNYNGSSKNDANYIETSATSLFSAAFFKAVRLGLLSDSYKDVAKNAFEGLVNNFMTYDANGGIQIWGSCKSAGLGGGNYRDGSNEYYLSGSDVTMVNKGETTEGKVLGGFIMAATEYERAYQNQDNKQILFAKDLAPKYDFSTTDGSLDATAYGNGTITYQWYKDNAKVTDATSATFSPTESGEYYCIATANGTNITTSKTNVTVNVSTGGDETPKADEGTVTFSGDNLKNYSSPMTDATKTVTITTVAGTIQKESGGDIKVAKNAAFTISVPKGKYITSITYTIQSTKNGELTFAPVGTKTTGSDGLTYTYNYSDNTINSVTATNSANKGGIKVTSIKVTYASTTKKYTVTATFGEGGTVAIKNGSDKNVTSGTEVEENTSLTFTAKADDGYEFVNWTNASNEAVSTENPYTTKVSAAINIKANFKKKEVTPSTGNESVTFAQYVLDKLDSNPGSGTSEVSEKTIGEITITAIDINGGTGRGIKMSRSNGSSFKITAANGAKIKKVIITQDREDRTLGYNPAGTESKNNSVFTYDYSNSLPKEITVSANSEGNIYVSAITVEYESSTPSTPKTALTATFASNSVPAIVGDEGINAPELTVTAGETPLVEGVGYSVSYTSGNENVVKKQEDGTLDAVGKGTATITATITPADGTKYNNTTLTFTINVSARPLKAVFSTNTVSANVDDEPRVLPKLTVTDVNMQQVSDYTATYTSTYENVATVVDGKLNFVGAGKTTIKVTVTPTDENTFAPCEASFDVSVADETTTDPTKDAVVYDFKTSVGNTESANANIKVNSDNIMFGTNFKPNESKYITITPYGDG